MKKINIGISIILFIIVNQIQAQDLYFRKYYFHDQFNPNGPNTGILNYAIETMKDGSIVTIGFGSDAANQSTGILSLFSCTGDLIWTKNLGLSSGATNTNFGIAEASNGDIVICFNHSATFFSATMLITRTDRQGNVKWSNRLGVSKEFGRDMVATKDGGFVIAGSTGVYGIDHTRDDIYLLKIDSAGTLLWTKTFGTLDSYDQAFAIESDPNGNLYLTGRLINRGTFMGFLMKTDPNGNPMKTIAIGAENHSTNGYDLAVLSNGDIALTGFTTILEQNFQDRSDLMVGLFDKDLNTKWINTYEIAAGTDNGALGESIAEMKDGGLAIVSESASFTNHNLPIPQAAGKWLGTIIERDGKLRKAYLYNLYGSGYPKIKKSSLGGFVIAGTSTYNTLSRAFQMLMIKTDDQLLNDNCEELDVTGELITLSPSFIVEDYNYTERSGGSTIPYNPIVDGREIMNEVVCEKLPEFSAKFSAPNEICQGQEIEIKDESITLPGVKYKWQLGTKEDTTSGSVKTTFQSSGEIPVILTLQFGCITKSFEKIIKVNSAIEITKNDKYCALQQYVFNGKIYEAGTHIIKLPAQNGCDTSITLNLEKKESSLEEKELFCGDSIIIEGKAYNRDTVIKDIDNCILYKITTVNCNEDCLKFPNVFAPFSEIEQNRTFRPILNCQDSATVQLEALEMEVYNRFGIKVFETKSNTGAWDGYYKGEISPMETYIYIAEYSLRYGDSFVRKGLKQKGSVSLIK